MGCLKMSERMTKEDVSAILDTVGKWDNVPYTVESDRVWISGSYSNVILVARQMTEHLVYEEDIPCGLPYVEDESYESSSTETVSAGDCEDDPPEGRFSGVAFNWYDPADLDRKTVSESIEDGVDDALSGDLATEDEMREAFHSGGE